MPAIVFGKTEYELLAQVPQAEPDKVAVFDDSVKPIADAGLAETIAGRCTGFAEEITLIPTPGHSPGHMSILIESGGQQALLTGDVAHHPCQMAHLDWCSTVGFRHRPIGSNAGTSCSRALPTRRRW